MALALLAAIAAPTSAFAEETPVDVNSIIDDLDIPDVGETEETPISSKDLAPGTCTVSANMYVSEEYAPIGVNAYMTDGGFPPITPAKNNAKLVVTEDSIQLQVSLVQNIFTLQNINDTSNATVGAVARGGELQYIFPPETPLYTDRITDLTLNLLDTSGHYEFTNVVIFPTVLGADQTWPINVSVDFAGAVRQRAVDATRTFTDETTGVTVTVNAENGSSVIDVLDAVTLSVVPVDTQDRMDAAAAAIEKRYVTTADFSLYEIRLMNGSEEIELDAQASASVSVPTELAGVNVHRVAGADQFDVEANTASGAVSFVTGALGTFALVDSASAIQWAGYKYLPSETDGLSLTYYTTGKSETDRMLSFDSAIEHDVINAFFTDATDGQFSESARAAVEGLGDFENLRVNAIYGAALDQNNWAFGLSTAKHSSYYNSASIAETLLQATIPAGGAAANYTFAYAAGTLVVTEAQPGTDEPGTDAPGTDEPGTDEPGTGEPGTDEPGTDEPVIDEPTTDEPTTDDSGTTDSGTKDSTTSSNDAETLSKTGASIGGTFGAAALALTAVAGLLLVRMRRRAS